MAWAGLSLKARVTLLFAALLVAGLTVNVGRLFGEARPRVAAEDESGVRLGTDLVRSAVPAIDAAPDPVQTLSGLVKSLRHLRHVTVSLRSEAANPREADDDARSSDVPSWFVKLVRPERLSTAIEISAQGKTIDAIVIASKPLDEIDEIWDGIVSQIAIGSTLAIALLAITYVTVDRALAPIADLSRAIQRIGEGTYDIRIHPSGPPEIANICHQLNRLAGVLGSSIDERQKLVARIVTLQDDERRDLARELHDEFGPHLFAIRAQVAALARATAGGAGAVNDVTRAIADQVDALQKSNRRVLGKLRPAALDDLGLEAALRALIGGLRDARPQVEVDLISTVELGGLGPTTDLTLYRVVQESLVNAFRHADATKVEVTIDQRPPEGTLRIRVADNGLGLPQDFQDGLGLKGMKERLAALGGSLKVEPSTHGGTKIEALMPMHRQSTVETS